MSNKKYRPSNGTEGMLFISDFCENCIHEKFMHTQDHNDKQCDILDRSFLHEVDEPEYPSEWTYDEDGSPTCTAHVKWDWGDDGDPDDPDNPKAPKPPPPPNQLNLFPLSPNEKDYQNEKKYQNTN